MQNKYRKYIVGSLLGMMLAATLSSVIANWCVVNVCTRGARKLFRSDEQNLPKLRERVLDFTKAENRESQSRLLDGYIDLTKRGEARFLEAMENMRELSIESCLVLGLLNFSLVFLEFRRLKLKNENERLVGASATKC